MKKIFSLLFVIMLAITPVMAQDVLSDISIRETLREVVVELNKECPTVIDEESMVTAYRLTDTHLIMYMTFTTDEINFSDLEDELLDLVKDMIKDEITDDEDFQVLMEICAFAYVDMRLCLTDAFGTKITLDIPCRE